jgi:hypothetical protein
MNKFLKSAILMLLLFSLGCQQSPTEFTVYNFLNYTIEIPKNFVKEGQTKWVFTKDPILKYVMVYDPIKAIMSNEQYLEVLKTNATDAFGYIRLEFQRKENVNIGGVDFLISYYKMNHNKNSGGFPVMSYHVFATVLVNNSLIAIESFSLGANNQAEMRHSVLSIKPSKDFN